ncbi:hypothetical protein [Paenibacillus sp. Soil750]|uniref:hypothetical protein n=1 Tax=Paenibacillus sp. Soil750 TaxID=1736398 RepID=UPI0012FC8283|nr:hypothetical protein [Paenibacillus sp. Soil750]
MYGLTASKVNVLEILWTFGDAHRVICMAMITELEQHLRDSLAPEESSLLLVWMKKIHTHLPKES